MGTKKQGAQPRGGRGRVQKKIPGAGAARAGDNLSCVLFVFSVRRAGAGQPNFIGRGTTPGETSPQHLIGVVLRSLLADWMGENFSSGN